MENDAENHTDSANPPEHVQGENDELLKTLEEIRTQELERSILEDLIARETALQQDGISLLRAQIDELESTIKAKLDEPTADGVSLNQKLNDINAVIRSFHIYAVAHWPIEGGKYTVEDWVFTRNKRRKFRPGNEKELLKHLVEMMEPPFSAKYKDKPLCDMIEAGTLPPGMGEIMVNYHLAIKRG